LKEDKGVLGNFALLCAKKSSGAEQIMDFSLMQQTSRIDLL